MHFIYSFLSGINANIGETLAIAKTVSSEYRQEQPNRDVIFAIYVYFHFG